MWSRRNLVPSSVFFVFVFLLFFWLKNMYCKTEAHSSTPPSLPIWIYLQYECITLWFSPEPGNMFSSADNGTVAILYCFKYLLIPWPCLVYHCIDWHVDQQSLLFWAHVVSTNVTPFTAFLQTTNLHRRSWDMHNLHAWSSSHYSHFLFNYLL